MPTTSPYTIEVFHVAHLAELLGIVPPETRAAGQLYMKHPGMTVRYQGLALFSAGVVVCYASRSMGEAWALMSPAVDRHRMATHRLCRKWLGVTARAVGLRRVQATVPVSFEKGRRWMEHLGMEEEATLQCYGPQGEDMVMYRWLPQGRGQGHENRVAEALANR